MTRTPRTYGATMDQMPDMASKPRKSASVSNLSLLLATVFVPFVTFTMVMYVRSFDIHYSESMLSSAICFLLLLVTMAIGWMAFQTTRSDRLMTFMFLSCAVAWCAGFVIGDYNYVINMRPFYDINELNTYPSVDPSIYNGQQLMDAGQIDFVAGSHLDLTKSQGFKNGDVFCVAPIVGPKQTGGNNTQKMATYDFWAVGKNCCSGHRPDFHCGEYNNVKATKGLRFMHDDQRDFFRLAVKQAEASFNIKSNHPIFMYWMQHPSNEVNAYRDDGYNYFGKSVFCFFGVQLALTVIGVVSFL